MKLSNATRITRDDLPDLPAAESFDLLLDHINTSNEQLTQALQQNLTIGDNMNAAIVTQRMTHGTEITIKNPLKVRPVGIKALRTIAINGGTQYALAGDPAWRFIDGPDPTAPQQIGITAYFRPPASSGYVGESSRSTIASGSAVSLTTATAANVASLSLGAGDWDVCGLVINGGSPTGFTEFAGAVNTTSANIGTSGDNQGLCVLAGGIPTITSIAIPPRRYTLTTTTSIYLVARGVFTGGTCTAYGRIEAVRASEYVTGAQNDIAFVVYGG